jgi:hypothetical protein
MAADSSFDPLALVKAMGPQRDPYSWAEAYAADAAKSQQLLAEMKNRMMVHESDQKARAHEGAENRKSHMTIAEYQQSQANKRAQMTTDRYKLKLDQAGKNADLGPNVITPQDYAMGTIGIGGPQINRGDYDTIMVHGKVFHKKKGTAMPSTDPRRLPDPNPYEAND